MTTQSFGGDWTKKKLRYLAKYLPAYTTIMRKQNFKDYVYVDAFAGTGWSILKQNEERENQNSVQLSLLSILSTEVEEFGSQHSRKDLDGSARIALKTNPEFTKYIFIEKNKQRFRELQKLKEDFPDKQIIFENSDANNYIKYLCQNIDWIKTRAVLFLDPFGMNVNWQTIELIASTKAIDLWYLFPMGMALNRLLRKDGNISRANKETIDKILGTSEWYNSFYETYSNPGFFDNNVHTQKITNFSLISTYITTRFGTIFPGVASNPRMLFNSKKNPLYLLCFASANPKGAQTAIKIAQDILKRE